MKRRTHQQKKTREWKQARMKKPEGKSKYARKRQYLHKNGLWGFEVRDKPWK